MFITISNQEPEFVLTTYTFMQNLRLKGGKIKLTVVLHRKDLSFTVVFRKHHKNFLVGHTEDIFVLCN